MSIVMKPDGTYRTVVQERIKKVQPKPRSIPPAPPQESK